MGLGLGSDGRRENWEVNIKLDGFKDNFVISFNINYEISKIITRNSKFFFLKKRYIS